MTKGEKKKKADQEKDRINSRSQSETHNSGSLDKVTRAGATRLPTNASLMPRRASCKPVNMQ